MAASHPFDILIGEQVSAVSFVQDYVQFHFDGPVLTALSNPILKDETGTIGFPAPGSRDKLCTLIAQLVRSVDLVDGDELRIVIGSSTLIVPLDLAHARGPESMLFQDTRTAPCQVWNAGE
jgi:hypothetical protein